MWAEINPKLEGLDLIARCLFQIEIEAILALNLHLAHNNCNNQNAVPNSQGYPLARVSVPFMATNTDRVSCRVSANSQGSGEFTRVTNTGRVGS